MENTFYNLGKEYTKVSAGVFIGNELTLEEIKVKLDNTKYAFFDLDGTIYPSFFILDVTMKIFAEHALLGEKKYIKKKARLNSLISLSKKMEFYDIYNKFILLLKNESYAEFSSCAQKFIINLCVGVGEFTKFLKSKGINSILVSLAPKFIADIVVKELSFDGHWSMDYKIDSRGKKKFSGEYEMNFLDLPTFKKEVLRKYCLKSKDKNRIFFAGNSVEDLELFNSAGLALAVNPPLLLLEKRHFNIVLRGFNNKPWEKLTNLLR